MKTLALLLSLLALYESAGTALPRTVVVNLAVWAEAEPRLDGRLDDLSWQKAFVHSGFFEYYRSRPKLSPIKSEMRVLYTADALWVGITHLEPRTDMLKVLARVKDDVSWQEDMDEVYIHPASDDVGYFRLMVNSAAVTGDIRRIDDAVVQNDWNGAGWWAETHVEADRWHVEMRIPYSDLQCRPDAESVWRLCVTRFQWTTGSFVGSVSSPGGSYDNPGGFGYLYFVPRGEVPNVARLAKALQAAVAPPWCAECCGRMLLDEGQGVQDCSIGDMLAGRRGEMEEELASISVPRGALAESYGRILSAWRVQKEEGLRGLADYANVMEMLANVRDFKWKLRLLREFGGED